MIILALGERKLAFHHLVQKRKKTVTGGDEVGKMRSKEGSKGCHQRDILLPNDTNKQHRELMNTGTNRSIIQPTECWGKRKR